MKVNIKKITIIILILLPVFIIIPLIVTNMQTRPVDILPSSHYYIQGYWPYSNAETKIHSFKYEGGKIIFIYTLGGDNPFAGIGVNLVHTFPFLDLSGYDYLRLTLSTEKAEELFITIRTFEPGITKVEDGMEPLRHSETHIKINQKKDTYDIPLASFKDPEWWLSQNVPGGHTIEKNRFIYASKIQLFIIDRELIGVLDVLTIDHISLYKNPLPLLLIIITAAVYYMVLGLVMAGRLLIKRQAERRLNIIATYNKIDLISYRTQDTEKISHFLKENYNDPEISMEKIYKETGISKKRISEILQEEYKMTFKELINLLRIEEAKRLLEQTDFNINEIAFRLGYNSNSYFGHIFKTSVGISPKEYREKKHLK
jgi:AraC-like DNA-binding protein